MIRKYILKTALWFFVTSIISVVALKWVPVLVTPLIIKEKLNGIMIKKEWVSLGEVSTNLKKAIIAAEDQNFHIHNGFELEAIKKAIENNQNTNNKLRGGSTLSQQTAKNVYLLPVKSYVRKGFEAYFTVLIEIFWGKDRILEIYLNIAEFGPGVFGAEAASEHYFKTSAKRLTVYQAATLAALLPSPKRYSKNLNSAYMNRRKNWISKQMKNISLE